MSLCYMCSGERVVPVPVWEDRKDPIEVDTTCPRCGGSGEVTDGFTANRVIEVGPSKQPVEEAGCICNYTHDGAEGHPGCPAR